MALHHKICCTVLGGSLTHRMPKPGSYVSAFDILTNVDAATEALAPLRELFGERIAEGSTILRPPRRSLALRNFGLTERDLDKASDLAVKNSSQPAPHRAWRDPRNAAERLGRQST